MTDQEKLQKLFDAALRDSSPIEKAPTRAVPTASATPVVKAMIEENPASASAPAEPETPSQPAAEAPVLDKEAAEELGTLLDEQVRRRRRKHRIESMVAAVTLIGLTGGSAGWFVQSPERMQALLSVIAEIRSVGDVQSMVAKYEAALKRISARGQQIDQASSAMGVKPGEKDEKDAYFDTEMKQMMGGEGKTAGERAGHMRQAFGKMQEKHAKSSEHVASTQDEGESIGWNQ
jgi:hypothetical protein